MILALAEVTVVLTLAWMLDRFTMTRLRPQVRHAIWTLVAIRLLMPAGVPGVGPATVRVEVGPVQGVAGVIDNGVPLWVLAVWASGVAIFLAHTLWQARAAGRRLRHLDRESDSEVERLVARIRAIAERAGLRHVPAIRIDSEASSPYVTGLRSPRLVLPVDWRSWQGVTLEHALAHELLHIARRDLLAEAVWMLIACAYWFHPLAHVARRRAHEAREMCCDADARARLGPSYRLTLLHSLASAAGELNPTAAAAGTHAWHPVIARLHALDRWPRPPTGAHRVALVGLVLAAAAAVLPAHVALVPHPAAVAVDKLLDPVVRQELGFGSLHLRYALLAADAARVKPQEERSR